MSAWIGVFPLHGSGCLVVLTDVTHEFSLQIRNRCEHPAGNDVALDLAEPKLDLVQPGGVRGSEVQVNLRVLLDEPSDLIGLVGREVVDDHVDLFAPPLIDHDVGEEGDKLRRGVPLAARRDGGAASALGRRPGSDSDPCALGPGRVHRAGRPDAGVRLRSKPVVRWRIDLGLQLNLGFTDPVCPRVDRIR